MTNFQWALLNAGMMKTLSHAKLIHNRMLIIGEGLSYDPSGKCGKKIVAVVFRGVKHHNDKWEIIARGVVEEGPFEIPFKGPEGYRY